MRLHLRFIVLIGVIVPRRLRADWRREWEAELRHREELLAEWERLDWGNKLDLVWRSTSAFWDALWMQPKRLEDDMVQDLSYGARMLRKTPGFTLVALLTLALGIGASTAIFSAVNPILFEPLPYPHAERIAMVWYTADDGSRDAQSFGTFRELAERSRSFEALAVTKLWQPTMTGPSEPERFDGQFVSASYFRALGVGPALGRDFDPAEDRLHGPNMVILSDGLWRRRFGGDPAVIGRQLILDDNSYTVIGVAPRGFENVLAPSAEIWTLLQYDASLPPLSREWGHHLRMLARLRPGVGIDQARRELGQIARNPIADFSRDPDSLMKQGFIVNALQEDITRGVKPALLSVLAAVLLVLLIACVNVTNLLLARGARRRGEFAMRAALGAPRARMIRQLLTESMLLAIIGGGFGLFMAEIGVRALVALSPAGLPRVGAIGINGQAFAFAFGVSALIGVAVGLIPALGASRIDLREGLQQNSRSVSGARHRMRRALVAVEVALALVLLVGAGLLLRSLQRLFSEAPGFNTSGLLTMQVQTYGRRFDYDNVHHRFFAQALDEVRQVSGVTAASFTSQLPLSGDDPSLEVYGVQIEQRPIPSERLPAYRYAVTPSYFEMMGIPLLRGRLFDDRDMARAPVRAVLISESFANRAFPGQDPIGKRVRFGGSPDRPWDMIIGVVGDVKQASLAESQSDAIYSTTEQWLWAESTLWLTVRSHGDVAALTPAIRKAIWSVDKDQPIVRVAMMDDLLAATGAERRFALILFEAFGLAALTLAAIGIYGALSGAVNERTREIGVRLALGAERRDVLIMILRQGLELTLYGVGFGLLASWAVTRVMTKMLYRVSATDPLTFGAVALLLTVIALLACYLPARRATKIDPLFALRQE